MAIPEVTGLIWACAGLIGAGSLATYLWRNPKASAKIRHKDSEIALNPSPDVQPFNAAPESVEIATDQPKQLPSGDTHQLTGTDVEEESRFSVAYGLLSKGDYETGKGVLEEAAGLEGSRTKRVALLAFGQHLAASRGETTALTDLKALAESNSDVFEAGLWLGVAEHSLGLNAEAIATFATALSRAASDNDRASALLWSIEPELVLRRSGDVANDILAKARQLQDHRARSRVIARVAKLYLDASPPTRDRAFALYELAISLDPTNASLRFDVAHAYGDLDAETLAFYHYSRIVEQEPDNNGAHNNLGVAAASLEMQSVAVTHYRRAEALGNTLASANLAWKLITAGFLPEARAMLDAAAANPEMHRNVLSALGGIAKAESTDDERREQAIKRARWYRDVARVVGESLASGCAPSAEFEGSYQHDSTSLAIHVTATGNATGTITATFQTRDFAGTIVGDSMSIIWTSRKQERTTLLGSLYDGKTGHGVFAFRNGLLEGYTYEGDLSVDPTLAKGYEAWTFRRSDTQSAS